MPPKQDELAAQAHRTASEHSEEGDNPTGNRHAERALEHSDRAHELAGRPIDRFGQNRESSARFKNGSHCENRQRTAALEDGALALVSSVSVTAFPAGHAAL
jgi:hypothetical protein